MLNLAALAVVAGYVALMMREDAREPGGVDLQTRQVAVFGLVLLSPFAAHVLWLGNTTLLVIAALIVGWRCASRGQHVMAGVLLAVAAVKPQLVLLPGLWLLLERRWVTIGAAAATSLVLSAYAMVVYGPIAAFTDWFGGILYYIRSWENQFGCIYCFGIADLLAAGELRIYYLEVAALIGCIALWWVRARLTRLEILALLSALGALFLPVHNYDLIMLAPVVGALGALTLGDRRSTVLALVAAALFYIPLRFVALAGDALLLRWREVILVAIVVGMIVVAERRTAARADASARRSTSAPI